MTHLKRRSILNQGDVTLLVQGGVNVTLNYSWILNNNFQWWIVVYPNFLNSRKTIKDGRKIAKSKAVDNPRCNEMKDVLQYHGFNCLVEEQKQYPRDSAKDALCKGRVRIQLKNSDGTLFNPNYPSRESLMILLGEMIPKLKSRQAKGATAETISQSSKKGKEKKKK